MFSHTANLECDLALSLEVLGTRGGEFEKQKVDSLDSQWREFYSHCHHTDSHCTQEPTLNWFIFHNRSLCSNWALENTNTLMEVLKIVMVQKYILVVLYQSYYHYTPIFMHRNTSVSPLLLVPYSLLVSCSFCPSYCK